MARHAAALVEVVLTLVLLPVFVIVQPIVLLVGGQVRVRDTSGTDAESRQDAWAPRPWQAPRAVLDPRVAPGDPLADALDGPTDPVSWGRGRQSWSSPTPSRPVSCVRQPRNGPEPSDCITPRRPPQVITSMKCEWCGKSLTPDQALAYWPRSAPGDVRFVCRPAPTHGAVTLACFRAAVQGASVHAIAPATQVTRP